MSQEYANWQDDQFKAIMQCGVGVGLTIIGAPEVIVGTTVARIAGGVSGAMTVWGCADVGKKAP